MLQRNAPKKEPKTRPVILSEKKKLLNNKYSSLCTGSGNNILLWRKDRTVSANCHVSWNARDYDPSSNESGLFLARPFYVLLESETDSKLIKVDAASDSWLPGNWLLQCWNGLSHYRGGAKGDNSTHLLHSGGLENSLLESICTCYAEGWGVKFGLHPCRGGVRFSSSTSGGWLAEPLSLMCQFSAHSEDCSVFHGETLKRNYASSVYHHTWKTYRSAQHMIRSKDTQISSTPYMPLFFTFTWGGWSI